MSEICECQDFGHAWPLKRHAAAAEGLIETEGVVLMVVARQKTSEESATKNTYTVHTEIFKEISNLSVYPVIFGIYPRFEKNLKSWTRTFFRGPRVDHSWRCRDESLRSQRAQKKVPQEMWWVVWLVRWPRCDPDAIHAIHVRRQL